MKRRGDRSSRHNSIRYTVVESPLGLLFIAATDAGIAWLGIGASERTLEEEFRSDRPDATLRRDDASLTGHAEAIIAFLEGRGSFPTLKLDVNGTPFQRRVWDELLAIPVGTTRSYGEIAIRLGSPRGARAVGTAGGANPVSILIPCHRALRRDGTLGGYRWGLDRKRRLLELEAAVSASSHRRA